MDKHILANIHTKEGLQSAVPHMHDLRRKIRPGMWRYVTLPQRDVAHLLDGLLEAAEREAKRVD